jgi:uncharacterized protein (TIGR00369 family)
MTDAINELNSSIPLHGFLGIHIAAQGGGRSRIELPQTDKARGYVAPLHGGVVAILVDIACAATLSDLFDVSVEIPVSTDLHVRYFRQPRAWPIRAEGQLTNRGRTTLDVECVLRDGNDAELARAYGTYVIVRDFGKNAARS